MLSSVVGWAKIKLLVEQATGADNEPTPIYVMDEVAAALAAGDARAGVDAVVARLGHRSPAVKQKALRLVAHLGRKGSPEVRRLLARQGAPLRDLLHFRCDPDPFTGDAVWRRVQQAAQEALAAVHGEPEAAEPTQSSLGGRIQGFGSDAASSGMRGFGSEGSGGGGGGGGGRMVGFGSADVLQSGVQAVSSGVRSLGSKAGGLLREDGYSSSQLDGGGAYGYGGGMARPAAPLSQPIVQAGGPLLAPPSAAGAPRPAGSSGQPSSSSSSGEQRAVDRVCTPAGLRAAPAREDLAAFVAAISPLDGPTVAGLLERKLEAGPWQSTLRALCAIEAVLEGGASVACGQVAAHFAAHPEAVQRAADSPQASVRQRAAKLLAALGAEGGGVEGAQQQQQQQQLFTEDLLGDAEVPGVQPAGSGDTVAAATDLADLLGEPASAAATAQPGGRAPLAAAPADLLAGLDISAPSDSPAPGPAAVLGLNNPPPMSAPAAADPFGGMLLGAAQPQLGAASSAAAAPQPAAFASDLLGGLSLQGPTPAPAAPALQAGGGLGDLLGGLSGGSAAAPAAQLGGGAFSPQGLQQPFGGMALPGMMSGAGPGMPAQPNWQQSAAPQLAGVQGGPIGGGAGGTLHLPFGGSGPFHHGRQPSLNGGSMSRLSSSGIIDSAKDSSFNFVDDAIAAARRKK